jgi:rRNA maturation RNase YbeY
LSANDPWLALPPAGIFFDTAEAADPLPFPQENVAVLTEWITQIVALHDGQMGELQYVFGDDDFLHAINVEHLDHDTLTDIITFPYGEPGQVWGDIFISSERVADNARELGIDFAVELRRVLIHGVLHLLGFGDKTEEEATRMRTLEDQALARYPG